MTGLEFDRWMCRHRMNREQAAAFFKRKSPRTIDNWRKGRVPVPELVADICTRSPSPVRRKRGHA